MKTSLAVAGGIVWYLGYASGNMAAGFVLAVITVAVLALLIHVFRTPEPRTLPTPTVVQAVPIERHRSYPRYGRWFVGFSVPVLGPIRMGVYRRIGR